MNKRILVALCVCCMVVGAVTLVSAERPKEAEKLALEGPDNPRAQHDGPAIRKLDAPVKTKAPKNRLVGTITYDDGMLTALPSLSSYCWGNHFDTAAGSPVQASGSVTQLQFFMATGVGTDGVFVSVYGPPVGTTAPFLDDISVTLNNGSATWNTATITAQNYTGTGFLAGVWYVAGDSVGLGSGTVGMQGHHGMRINDIVGTDFATVASVNAMVRATGDVLVPVELMSFSVQ